MYTRVLVLLVLVVVSSIALYRYYHSNDQHGREFSLTLTFQNPLLRSVSDAAYTVKLPYGFQDISSNKELTRVSEDGQKSVYLAFSDTQKYSGQRVQIDGYVDSGQIPDIVTNPVGCIEPLNNEECDRLAGNAMDALNEIALELYDEYEVTLATKGFSRFEWTALVVIYSQASAKAKEAGQIRIIAGVDAESKIYAPKLMLQHRQTPHDDWVFDDAVSIDQWFPVEIFPSLNISLSKLALVNGYGLKLVGSDLLVAPQSSTNN